MTGVKIKLNQIWESKTTKIQIIIAARKPNNRWTVKYLTDKDDYYSGTHKMHERTIWGKFTLIK